MPNNTNYVCFDCRKAVCKPKTHTQAVHCPQCGRPMTWLTYKLAISKQHKKREWQVLYRLVSEFPLYQHNRHVDWVRQYRVAEIAELRKQLLPYPKVIRRQKQVARLRQLQRQQRDWRKKTWLVHREFCLKDEAV